MFCVEALRPTPSHCLSSRCWSLCHSMLRVTYMFIFVWGNAVCTLPGWLISRYQNTRQSWLSNCVVVGVQSKRSRCLKYEAKPTVFSLCFYDDATPSHEYTLCFPSANLFYCDIYHSTCMCVYFYHNNRYLSHWRHFLGSVLLVIDLFRQRSPSGGSGRN